MEEYIRQLPEDRKVAIVELRKALLKNLPKGFAEVMQYGMPGYVVPHSLYPAGYHTDPKQALPFISFASQKNFIAVYHMTLSADPVLMGWFEKAYAALGIGKLDMGKSCIRFKKPAKIPFALIGQLAAKITPKEFIAAYEKTRP